MGLTQSQAVSTTSTFTGQVVPQLALNIVARHMVNILMHIPGLICFSECPCMPLSEKNKVPHLISTLNFVELRRGVSLDEHLNHNQPGKHSPPSKPSVTSTLA